MKLELLGEVLRVEVRERETVQETREIAEAVLAAATDDRGLHAAHEYIELLAAQRGVRFRAFTSEREALAWLRSGAA